MSYIPTPGQKIEIMNASGFKTKFDEEHRLYALISDCWICIDNLDRGELEDLTYPKTEGEKNEA